MERVLRDDESTGSGQPIPHAQSSFGRDFTSSVHLYLTHWMWVRTLGYELHPNIPKTGELAIACINDSTGIWSIDVARKYPNARCDSFDVSGEQFPPATWVPKNVNLVVLDFTKPIPMELRGQYDVVRCPWISLHARKGDFMKIVDNLISFLKPGGYFQWEEADIASVRAIPSRPDMAVDDMQAMSDRMNGGLQHVTGSDFKWISELDKHARSRRMQIVSNNRHQIPDDIALPWTLQHLMAAMGMIQNMEEDSELAADWLDTYDRAAIAVMNGVSMRMDIVCCLCQTPIPRVSQSEALKSR